MELNERELNVIYLSLHLMESTLYDKPTMAKRKSAKEVANIKEKITWAWIRAKKSEIKKRKSNDQR